ncbi:hypothetical protein C8Q73DRAFT_790434 [Cubamyces lactineus]|nr:hypothetical protein C8Q73DRAFT_790434 [Cubamyces lactineus]
MASRNNPCISEYNERIRWFVKCGLTVARKAVIYESHSRRSRLVFLAAREDWDPACGAPLSTDDLDMSDWLGSTNHRVTRMNRIPGTDCYLRNGFDIVTLRPDGCDALPNATIQTMFSKEWVGNLLVVKRGCHDPSRAISVTQSEVSTIDALVDRWLELYLDYHSPDDE